jgi:hypothetical protein
VLVSSVPAGARIVLDGVDTGQVTPATIAVATLPGALELTLAGYRVASAEIAAGDVEAGRKELRLTPEPQPVRLTASGPYPFEVYQGARSLSPAGTHHEMTVQPGGAPVTLRSAEMLLNFTVPIDFQRPRLEQTVPAPGILAVFSAIETCQVAVDGQDIGFPPIPRKPIAAGAHTVTLRCPDRQDTQTVSVASGERIAVQFRTP